MTRRKFIGVLGGAITLWPLLGIARQRKVVDNRRLGEVGPPGSEQFWHLFQKMMGELGYISGQSIRWR